MQHYYLLINDILQLDVLQNCGQIATQTGFELLKLVYGVASMVGQILISLLHVYMYIRWHFFFKY